MSNKQINLQWICIDNTYLVLTNQKIKKKLRLEYTTILELYANELIPNIIEAWNDKSAIICTYEGTQNEKNIMITKAKNKMIRNKNRIGGVMSKNNDSWASEGTIIKKYQNKFLSIVNKNIIKYLNQDLFGNNFNISFDSAFNINSIINNQPIEFGFALKQLLYEKIRLPHTISEMIVDYTLFANVYSTLIDIFPFQEVLSTCDQDEISTISKQSSCEEIDSTIAHHLTSHQLIDTILFLNIDNINPFLNRYEI